MTPLPAPRHPQSHTGRALAAASRLAFRDWRHEGLLTLCHVLSLVSVLIPLLILLGVRNGVVSTLEERLLENPALLTVTPAGSGPGYTRAWIEALSARPDVAFVIPKTREISSTVQMEHTKDGATRLNPVDVEPTGPGDPLLARYNAVPGGDREVTLSRPAAEKLGASAGSLIRARLGRVTAAGRMESLPVELVVREVLPLEAESRTLAFVTLPLLESMEDYKDGFAVPAFAAPGQTPPAERRFARFRLYARGMDDVAVLREHFAGLGVEVQTSARDIKTFQEVRIALTALFLLIAGAVAAGFAASTASSVLAAVRRKDRQLGMLRLLGFPGVAIMAFPLVQTQLTSLCGAALAGLLYLAIASGLDALFSAVFYGSAITLLPWFHFALISGGVALISLLASLPAAARATRVEPSEVLRTL